MKQLVTTVGSKLLDKHASICYFGESRLTHSLNYSFHFCSCVFHTEKKNPPLNSLSNIHHFYYGVMHTTSPCGEIQSLPSLVTVAILLVDNHCTGRGYGNWSIKSAQTTMLGCAKHSYKFFFL